jgi:hypothetical protein
MRAIWSAPPPVPAGTMNSTVRVGSQAHAAGEKTLEAIAAATAMAREHHRKSVIAIVTPTPF